MDIKYEILEGTFANMCTTPCPHQQKLEEDESEGCMMVYSIACVNNCKFFVKVDELNKTLTCYYDIYKGELKWKEDYVQGITL